MSAMNLTKVKYDCQLFKGNIPCKPNKTNSVQCDNCSYYKTWKKHILIINLSNIDDVTEIISLILEYRKIYVDVHFTWLTELADMLPRNDIQDIFKPTAFNIEKIKTRKFDIAINLNKEKEICKLMQNISATKKFGFMWKNNHVWTADTTTEHKIIKGLFEYVSNKQEKAYSNNIFENYPLKHNKIQDNNDSYYKTWKKHILIIKLGAMGDVIRTTPLVVRYRELYGDVHFTWLTEFPDVLPPNDIHDILNPTAFNIEKIKTRKFDIAINLDKEEEACKLLQSVSATKKFGFIWENNHLWAATPAAEHKIITGLFDHISKKNTLSYLEEIFEICHLKFNYEEYLLNYNKNLADKWKTILQKKANGKKIVGLNTGCGNRWQTRLWDKKYWIELINSFDKNTVFPILLGGPQENDKNTFIAENTNAWYGGTFSLEEFIALTSNLDAVVTQVSMMMHIAIGHKIPMVLMNNIFNKYEFEMYERGVIVEPQSGCDCYFGNVCKRTNSKTESCMKDLKPTTILKELIKLID